MPAIQKQLASDFALAQVEFQGQRMQATQLRYVAAVNPDATRQEFLDAAVAAGYHVNSAACRFLESRKSDLDADKAHGVYMDEEGTLVYPDDSAKLSSLSDLIENY